MKTNIDNAPQGTPSKDYRRINLIRCQEFSLFFEESIPVRVAWIFFRHLQCSAQRTMMRDYRPLFGFNMQFCRWLCFFVQKSDSVNRQCNGGILHSQHYPWKKNQTFCVGHNVGHTGIGDRILVGGFEIANDCQLVVERTSLKPIESDDIKSSSHFVHGIHITCHKEAGHKEERVSMCSERSELRGH